MSINAIETTELSDEDLDGISGGCPACAAVAAALALEAMRRAMLDALNKKNQNAGGAIKG